MLITLEGTSGQTSAVDAFDIGSIFPAAHKGDGGTIPVLGVSMIQLKTGQQIVVKESVSSLTERVNQARLEAARAASGRSDGNEAVGALKRLL